jgi:hypothetical protein
MFARKVAALAMAAALGVSHGAYAATDEDLKELREQLRQLREQYEKRIEALEQRLKQAETSLRAPTRAAVAPTASGPQPSASLNPAMSLILNGSFASLSQDPATYQITGFVPSMGEVGPPPRSFGLGESELALSASIDPHFRGAAFFALTPDNEIEVEEAYVQTLSLGRGLTVKAGRFLSSIGYHNEVHAHAWDFADSPLVSRAFLGGRYGEDGVQVRWVAPTDLYMDVGAEFGRGRSFPAGPDGGRNKNGVGAANLFAHVGGDIGTATAWQLGTSLLSTSPRGRTYDDVDAAGTGVTNSFSGRSRLWTLSGVLKWAPDGNASRTSLKLQGEYFRRSESGNLTFDTQAAGAAGTPIGGDFRSRQSGWYGQTVYQFMPAWRVGYRYDRLDPGSLNLSLVESGALTAADFPVLASHRPSKHSLMLDWTGSEFSRLRFQVARDRSRATAVDNQLLVQYIMSLGAHGAHRF